VGEGLSLRSRKRKVDQLHQKKKLQFIKESSATFRKEESGPSPDEVVRSRGKKHPMGKRRRVLLALQHGKFFRASWKHGNGGREKETSGRVLG